MPGYGLVHKKNDTKEKYDKRPFSSGPYKIGSPQRRQVADATSRNEHWDPATDPIRNSYPDKFVFQFGFEPLAADRPLHRGPGQGPVRDVDLRRGRPGAHRPGRSPTPTLKKRVLTEVDTVTYYWPINTTRIKDVKVREAIN